MNKKKLLMLAIGFTVATSNVAPGIQAFAATPSTNEMNTQQIAQPRFKYTLMAQLSLNVDSAGAYYNLYIDCVPEVNKISGTVTLYKKSSSGSFVKIDSENITEYSNSIDLDSYLSENGPGAYKATFKGKAYGPSGYDSISLSVNDSY